MQPRRNLIKWFSDQKTVVKVIVVATGILVLCCLCSIPVAILNPSSKTSDIKSTAIADAESTSAQSVTGNTSSQPSNKTSKPTDLSKPTNSPAPTNTPKPTNTPEPTNTPLPPTATPDPNLLKPGTYLVGTDIQPGLYHGNDSCYWERLKDLDGTFESILANDNTHGQFYIEVLKNDKALKIDCEVTYLPTLPAPVTEFPKKLSPGIYLVGIDIQPGTYKGNGESESCYWERLRDVRGTLESILANDNAEGQFFVRVGKGDFALKTACDLEVTK